MFNLSRFRLSALAAGALAACLTAACGAPGESEDSGSGGSGPIKIAVVNAQSGQLSSLGKWEHKGVKLAVDEWNKAGGINGRRIQLDVFDDQGDPTVGTNIARKIASQKYIAMLGTAESAVTIAMAPVLRQFEIPNIASGQSPGMVALKSPYLFLNGPTSTTYDETLAKHLADTEKMKKFALITNNGAYGKGEHDAFSKALADRGVKPVADEVVTIDQKDFSAQLTKIRQAGPEVVFLGAEEVESGLIVKQARDLGITVPFAGAAPQGTPVFIDTAGAKNAEGTIVSSPYLSNDIGEAARKFAAAYQAAFNEEAEMHGAKAYDGAQIMLTALKNSDVATGKKLADAIRAVRHRGLLGDFVYDETGVGIKATSIGLIKNGKLVQAEG
ncbi:ABC transporter substrate-binding protein [Actinomadura rugatobispora]|uniref:ABC transporter substrate-binding protein n=1 Tax=Actinomadura rugatobispora TaxID=1994 RepID=A0ABW0ZVM6_9ACTN|nr:ABC transporter substrate-binding protein [Actinomadura rugatobispora]